MADVTANDFIELLNSEFEHFGLTAPSAGEIHVQTSATELLGPFLFCLTFQGRQVATMSIFAPSPEEAAETVASMVRAANETMPGWHAFPGACP